MAALGIGLSIGTKSSSLLPLFSIGAIAIYVMLHSNSSVPQKGMRNTAFLAVFTLISVTIFALPAGYRTITLGLETPSGQAKLKGGIHSKGNPLVMQF